MTLCPYQTATRKTLNCNETLFQKMLMLDWSRNCCPVTFTPTSERDVTRPRPTLADDRNFFARLLFTEVH